MGNIIHSDLSGSELHIPGYFQASDPGAVGAGKYWIDTTDGAGKWILKVRNEADDGWEVVSSLADIPDSALLQITTAGKVSGSALTGLASIPAGAGTIPVANLGAIKVFADTTVNFTSAMTATAIQALIDALPKDLGGNTVTFQFADGTYTLSQNIEFTGFYGGLIIISGNITEDYTAAHTDQAVILDASASSDTSVLLIQDCQCGVAVRNLKIMAPDATDDVRGIDCDEVSGAVYIGGCYCVGTSVSYGHNIYIKLCPCAVVEACYVSESSYGITSYLGSNLVSRANASMIPNPSYGLTAISGGIRKDGDQPTGDVANELSSGGGSIV